MFGDLSEIVEMFKHCFPLSILFFVPIMIILSPVSPTAAAHEFAAFRMQQYDLQGSSYGCRNALVNVEARPIDSAMLTRRCVVARLHELTMDRYRDALTQGAGGLLLLLPKRLSSLNKEEREHLLEIEQDLMQEETQLPVYFVEENDEISDIYAHIKQLSNSDKATTATEALLSSATANGFQMVISGSQSKALSDYQLVNIQGKLSGTGNEEGLNTIVIVAHYDSYGIAPGLSKGADSNGSGVVALMELARLFSKLYANSRTHAKYNIVFLLSGAGKFNYLGTKRWIEDQLDTADSSLLLDVHYVLCLDALGSENALNLHVSKPPKEGSPGDIFYQHLQAIAAQLYPQTTVNMVHKKINLADDMLSWEHERFSIRRLPAFTLSHHNSHKSPMRTSILDTKDEVNEAVLGRNVKILAEALARHVFNITHAEDMEIFVDALQVEPSLMSSWLSYLTSVARPAQFLTQKSPVVHTLQQTLSNYISDVNIINVKADKRDPEFIFYDGLEHTMSAYNVKPAVFDLFLALGIAGYLTVLYFLIQHFSVLYNFVQKFATPTYKKKIY